MKDLFKANKELENQIRFSKLVTGGYKYTPTRSRVWIYPFTILFFIIGLWGIVSYILSYFTQSRGHIVWLLMGIFLTWISLFIYIGTAKFWLLRAFKKTHFNDFYKRLQLNDRGKNISYQHTATGNSRTLIKSFATEERYYPFISFLFSTKIDNYTCRVGSMTKTARPRYGRPAGSQQEISFVIIEGLPKNYDQLKLWKKDEIAKWLTNELGSDFTELLTYIYLLRVKGDQLLLEFKDTIHLPEKKIDVLNYLQKELQYEQSLFEKTWKLIQYSEWPHGELIQYIIQNMSITAYDNAVSHFIKYRLFYIGNLKFEFNLCLENEALEIETHYELFLKLTLVDDNDHKIKVLRDSVIFSREYIFLFHDPEFDQKIIGQEEALQLAISQILAPLDLTKKGNLLSYIRDEFKKDFTQIHQLNYYEVLMHLSLNTEKYFLHPFSQSEISTIEQNLNITLPTFYKKFLQVVGWSKTLDPSLNSNVEDFEYAANDGLLLFSSDDTDSAFYLGLENNPDQHILQGYTAGNHYGDSPYTSFKSFKDYLIERINLAENKEA